MTKKEIKEIEVHREKVCRDKSEIGEDILKRAWGVNEMLIDIPKLRYELYTMRLQDDLRKKALDVIDSGKAVFTHISLKKPIVYVNNHLNIQNRTVKELLNYENELTEDMNCLSSYQNDLINCINDIKDIQAKQRADTEFDLYDSNGKWFTGGYFESIERAVEKVKSYKLITGKAYYIIGGGRKADFNIDLNEKMANLTYETIQNNITITCKTKILCKTWTATEYKVNTYNLDAIKSVLESDKNVKDVKVKHPEYLYYAKNIGPGGQPKDYLGWKNNYPTANERGLECSIHCKHFGATKEVNNTCTTCRNCNNYEGFILIYNRKLTTEELIKYDLRSMDTTQV